MLANSLADVVGEETAKRLLPDLSLERKAKKAARVGIGVAKRLALVQTDIWAKRGAAGDIHELEPLVVTEEMSTRSAIEKVADELAQQGPLTHSSQRRSEMQGLQFVSAPTDNSVSGNEFLVSRGPCAAEVISQFRNKKSRHNESFETEPYPQHLIGQSGHPKHSQSHGAILSTIHYLCPFSSR